MYVLTIGGGSRLRSLQIQRSRRSIAASLQSAATAAVMWCVAGASSAAPINLVLDTGTNTPLPSRVTSNGAPTTVVGPANPTATINGVTIRYLGTELVTPIVSDPFNSGSTATGTAGKFFVSGDLTLNSDQKIFGIGPNLVKLEVGNNATLAAGSLIDVSGEGRTNGAGGGAGGSANPSGMTGVVPNYFLFIDNLPVGADGGYGGDTFSAGGINGTNGETPLGQEYRRPPAGGRILPGTPEYAALFRSVGGGAGAIGQGNLGVASGGVEVPYAGAFATQGSGGPGGPAGNGSGPFGGLAGGVNGGGGGGGGHGSQGQGGAHAGLIQEQLNPAAVYLRAGNGGGAGATGGDGLPGGWGGGGGGGGAGAANLNGARNDGGGGGEGGVSGLGGAAGAGGFGGGGGGGIQLLVRGSLNFGGAVTAAGGNAGAGQVGAFGSAGAAGKPGASGAGSNGKGGDGGTGGTGGNGGRGGTGGNGVGGSGGVVQIVSSNLAYTGSMGTTGGLAGDGVTRSANGAAYIHAYTGPGAALRSSTYFGARAAGANPYRSHSETLVFGGPPAGQFANVPAIFGGAAPYGVLVGSAFGNVASGVAAFGGAVAPPPAPGHVRVGAVTRVSAAFLANQYAMGQFNSNDQELLLYSAFGPNLNRPAMMAVDPGHSPLFDYVPTTPIRLREGSGYLNDPTVTPGAVAPTDMANLAGGSTFAMYASGTQHVTASHAPYGVPRTFSGTPTVGVFGSPGASTVFLEDNGLLYLGINGVSSTTGLGVGVILDTETSGEHGVGFAVINVRAGGAGVVTANVEGTGNVGTTTSGSVTIRTLQPPTINLGEPGPLYVQSTQGYSQIGVGQHWDSTNVPLYTKNLPLGTTQRVADVVHAPVYDENSRAISLPLDAKIFGPSPTLSGAGVAGSTFTLPSIAAGGSELASFNFTNADVLSPINLTWRNAITQSPQLIRLSVLGYELIDPSGAFSLPGMPASFVLNGNQSQAINVGFNPTTAGVHEAQLRLLTDVNAEVGQLGDTLTLTLRASAVTQNADFNSDGLVDGQDLLVWQRGLGVGTVLAAGDANGDGAVDGGDLGIWRQQFGSASPPMTSVPEPAGASLLIGIAAAASLSRKRIALRKP